MPDTHARSPAMVGRQELVALTRRRLDEVAGGRSHLLLVAGEAGIGKTRLLAETARLAEERGFAVVRATSFPGDDQASGALLVDLAGQLRRSDDRSSQSVGVALHQRLREPIDDEGDQHRRRRLLVQDLTDAIAALSSDRRLLLVLEDLHWADELSLEVLGHLPSGLARHAVLTVAAFRSDELYPGSAIREWRARLLAQRLAEEARLPRLTPAQTDDVVAAVIGRRLPADVLATLHERSDGIPLHVEELVRAAADRLDAAAPLADLQVPDTLGDAVLQRLADVDPTTRELAGAAAVIGRSFDFDLLVLVSEQPGETVDASLRLLEGLSLVLSGPTGFDFRHALIRDTLYADVSLPRRRQLHERVALAAVDRGRSPAFASAHFDLAQAQEPAYRYALAAGHEAAALSAHREARTLLRRALRNRPRDLPVPDHAALLTALAAEAAAVDDNDEAAASYRVAHQLWSDAGRPVEAASVVPPWVAALHLLGESLVLRVQRLQTALETLAGVEDVGVEAVRARLTGALAAAYMLDRRLDDAIAYGEQSKALSDRIGDEQTALNTAATLGSVLVFAGQADGWGMLADAIARSVSAHEEAEAARAYRMLGTSASVLVEYDLAGRTLADGMAYSAQVELWNHHHYMAAHLAHVQWARGDWATATATAQHALADGRGGFTTRITALYVLGYLALGHAEAEPLLHEALGLGESMAELQRISPPLWGLAENALLLGNADAAVALSDRGYALSADVDDAAYLFPFVLTGVRARLLRGDRDGAVEWLATVEPALARRAIPGTLPALAHTRGLIALDGGDPTAARALLVTAHDAWQARDRFWEGCWAGLDLARCATALRRRGEADSLATAVLGRAGAAGATALVTAADRLLTPDTDVAAWHPLSAREHEVAQLVGRGLTNREIAAELFLSPKTVSAHVEHILAKLGASRRAEIGAWVARVG